MTTETRDIGFASYLLCEGGKITGCSVREGRHRRSAYLQIEIHWEKEELREADAKYHSAQSRVEPTIYRQRYHQVSDIVFDAIRAFEGEA